MAFLEIYVDKGLGGGPNGRGLRGPGAKNQG